MPYVAGGDTAGEGSDYFIGQVIDNTDGEQVATLRVQNIDEDKYAEQMYCLGLYYNTALISVEVNYSTHPQKCLEKLKYPNLYLRKKEDVIGDLVQNKFGFKTTLSTRPALIANLVQFTRDEIDKINDIDTLGEMLTFIRNEKGRAEAEQGGHDDTIMGLGIAHYCRPQQSYIPMIVKKKISIKDKLPFALITPEELEFENDYEDVW